MAKDLIKQAGDASFNIKEKSDTGIVSNESRSSSEQEINIFKNSSSNNQVSKNNDAIPETSKKSIISKPILGMYFDVLV
tara:strand:+ start:1549 stop:1785 length:237 start_codon:yes stop_codon:yes gene_type:complete